MEKCIQKNKIYIMDIDGMGYDGSGVGRICGFTVFVPYVITGERVKVKIVKINKKFAFGRAIEIINQSEYRKEPICHVYRKCGGCQIQHISYEGQLNFKKERVKDCLSRIGKLEIEKIKLHDTIGMKYPFRYRNKAQLPVEKKNEKVKIGFYAKRSHEIIDMNCCYIQDKTVDDLIKVIRQWINMYNIPCYDEVNRSGNIRHVVVRKAFSTGETMVIIVTKLLDIPHKKELIKLICDNVIGIKSIIQNINRSSGNVILGNKNINLWGKNTIDDYIGNFKFNISPLSFFQVNPVQTEILYDKVLEYSDLKKEEIVFDAYCGTGTISLFLSQNAKKVYGIEIIGDAVSDAKKNALENNIDNVKFITGKSEIVIPDMINKGIKADVIVLDPPRKGCDRKLLVSIAKMGPKRIVYVSCDPGTLARDLGILDQLGYKTVEVQPVDMFCQTSHVECVVKLVRE